MSQTPQNIIQIFLEKGVNLEVNQNKFERNIESSFNQSNLSGNVAVQAENVNQIQNIVSENKVDEAFQELLSIVHGIEEEMSREQAEMNAELLRNAVESGDLSKGEKILKFLTGSLGLVPPLITIAQLAGLPVPSIPSP